MRIFAYAAQPGNKDFQENVPLAKHVGFISAGPPSGGSFCALISAAALENLQKRRKSLAVFVLYNVCPATTNDAPRRLIQTMRTTYAASPRKNAE
jgi:hypothetical protein